ncbi:two-component sensor histidine kinase [Ktedonobacter sp. SOSP1-85]|uniref:sensor histidine kinase n=1 Tax=Ktedonobacter sp. SOSP1-85 TaxID=2778367 RepID=UPI0019167F0C|nr:HAMP domain-containing sensor histidine kinase [Ktedonobacter sp. SOSP1-85]GHO76736.1 two-component sensor histidine kinase [Ktedonobacter sp. SOSP1-85]
MKTRWVIQVTAVGVVAMLLLCAIWTGTFFLTASLYAATGLTLPPFLIQVLNSLFGLLVFVLLFIAYIAWSSARSEVRRQRMQVFEPIIEAMKRIAKGDFQIRLDPEVGANGFTSELAKSVNQMAEELNQMEHMRQEFISNVSHEIQSPLTSIQGFAQALHDKHLSVSEREHYLGIIETESMRLSRMTENMLKLASLESKHLMVEPKPYRLDKQIRTLILACEPQWTRKAITMEVDLEEVLLFANEDLLSQVWSNLLHNSIKFTPEGGKVCVEVHRQDRCIECRITDTGIGIPLEAQTRIFERFYKVDASRERAREGSGLGLAIVRKIVELHQGTIKVVSQPHAGTSMFVSLPAAE